MSPAFFLLISLGGIICLTPLAIYLYWLSSLNRRPRPTVVSATWDFIAMLCGLSGFLFCIGALIAGAVTDIGLFTRGPFSRLAAWLPWLNIAWFLTVTVYLLLVVRGIRIGLARRRDALSVFNIDEAVLRAMMDEAQIVAGVDAPAIVSEYFAVFRHATVKLPSPAMRDMFERPIREIASKLPAARENPAAPWITSAATAMMICVCCSAILIFALPFLR